MIWEASALQYEQSALNIRVKLFLGEHSDIAENYHTFGATEHVLGDFTSAVLSTECMLDMFGDEHRNTAKYYHSLRVIEGALESKQKRKIAVDFRFQIQ